MNKLISKKLFIKNKIKTPNYFSINKHYTVASLDYELKRNKIYYPIIVKQQMKVQVWELNYV